MENLKINEIKKNNYKLTKEQVKFFAENWLSGITGKSYLIKHVGKKNINKIEKILNIEMTIPETLGNMGKISKKTIEVIYQLGL